ncbi:anti-sigma factor family protein [Ekhidna sp.]|uniref:anti-sigma factor family protein n=1 Tax=Ekhidna sp. TaxID=2608089 RepID=UPI003BAC76E2
MSYKPEESTMIAYLYGELSEVERKKVEEYLSGNDDARKDFEELKSTQSILNKLKDREVEVPIFSFSDSKNIVVNSDSGRSIWMRSLSIAASIILVLLFGYLTKFHVSYDENGLQMAFGEQKNNYSQTEVERMIAAAIDKNNEEINERIASTETGIQEFVSENTQSLKNSLVSQVNQTDFENQRRQYLSMLKEMIESSELEQKKYTDEVMTDFAIFLDIQRQNDLEVIQTRFNNLQDNAELNQFQTNQILANLISTVEDPNQY